MASTQYQSNKITRIVPYRTDIKSKGDYSTFFKKGISSPRTLNIEYLDTNYYHNSEARTQMQQRLIKLLKKVKPTKALNLHKCIVQYDNISDPTIIQIAKKTSRVKSLSLPDYALSQDLVEKYTLWLKYSKGLRKFDYIAPPCADFPNGHVRKFETTLHKFFHEIRRDRLNTINISHKISDDKLGNAFLMFNKYPSTLKSLAFDWRHYSTESDLTVPKIEKALGHMRDLTSISLAFRNQLNLIDPILSSIQNTSQIKTLKIEFLDNVEQESDLPLRKLGALPNLESLTLKFGCWPKGLEAFLDRVQSSPIKKLYIDAVINQETQIDSLKDVVTCLSSLESLTLKLFKDSPFESETRMKSLFEKIAQIRPLKNLKLNFKASSITNMRQSGMNVVTALKNAFAKPVKLEKFSFKFNQTESYKALRELVSLVTRVAPSLKKVEIDVGEFKVQDNDYAQMMNLVHRLQSVQSLKLNSLSVVMNSSAENLLDALYNLRSLETLELREIRGTLSNVSFVSMVERLLSKRGLKKFDCAFVPETKEARRTRCAYQIDLKNVIQRNPQLENYPHSSGMYVCYDDDIEWKWC